MRREAPLRFCAAALFFLPALALAQESVELIGQMGGRAALLHLHSTGQPDGSARLTGEYLVLPTMQQRYLDGERSKQLGVTILREGSSPILYGRPASATLQGTWADGVLKGMRFGPSGQQRERFEFSERFASMDAYSGNVRCEQAEGRYAASLAYSIEAGKLKSMEWRSKVAPSDHPCALSGLQQQPEDGKLRGALRFAAGRCSVTLRDLGDFVRVSAEHCADFCGSQGYLEPVLVDRRGQCQLIRPQQQR